MGSLVTIIMEPIGQMEDRFLANQRTYKWTTAQTTQLGLTTYMSGWVSGGGHYRSSSLQEITARATREDRAE